MNKQLTIRESVPSIIHRLGGAATPLVFLLAFFLSASLSVRVNGSEPSQSPSEEELYGFSQAVIDTLGEAITAICDVEDIPGVAVVVVDDAKILWLKTYGHTDRSRKTPVTPETFFSIQSMSKSFTALAILQAVQEGILDLDTPISTYLPEFTVNSRFERNPQDRITLRHLLSHTAGFTHEAPIGNNFDSRIYSFHDHIRSISDTWLKYPVGYCWSYSNLGFDLAGYILERASGIPFERYVEEKVFAPLGMEASTFDVDVVADLENRAIGHYQSRVIPLARIPIIPAGGVYTNVREMAHYLHFHINRGVVDGKRLIDEALLEEMYNVPFPRLNQRFGYCLGLWKQPVSFSYSFYHGGAGCGFSSGIVWFPELKIGAVVLTNSEKNGLNGSFLIRIVIESLIRSQFGMEEPVSVTVTGEESDTLAANDPKVQGILGRYGGSDARTIEIRNNEVGISFPGGDFYPLTLMFTDGQIVGKYGSYSEILVLPPLNNQPGTIVTKHRYMDICKYFGYNDGPNDLPGREKPEWERYLGEYQMLYSGQLLSPVTVSKRNGYLYYGNKRCLEYEPGLFFSCDDGEALDFRGSIPTFRNIKLYRSASE